MCPEPQTRPRPRCRSSTTKARGRARPPDSSDARRDPQDARARDRPVAPASRGTPRGARHNRTRHARRASPRHTPERHASPVKEPPHARSQMEDLLTGRARGPRRRPPEPHHPRNAALTPAGDSTERAFPSHQPRAEPSRRTVLRTVPGDQRTAPVFPSGKPGIQHHTGSCDAMQRPPGGKFTHLSRQDRASRLTTARPARA